MDAILRSDLPLEYLCTLTTNEWFLSFSYMGVVGRKFRGGERSIVRNFAIGWLLCWLLCGILNPFPNGEQYVVKTTRQGTL